MADDVAAIAIRNLDLWYGDFQALHDVSITVRPNRTTALIGPSGCGKSTLLRTVNRIVERLDYVRTRGAVEVLGHDVFDPDVELVQLRRKVGMVFQRPNPLPLSVRDNVLFGWRLHATSRRGRAIEDEIVEGALRTVQLWDLVKDRLDEPAVGLSLEAQQKLCIARLLPDKPEVLLMDEPCSALDPGGTEAVEELIRTLEERYTILVVTHNMAQASRVSEECVFMLLGRVVEQAPTSTMFTTPSRTETADYISGRYG